MKFSTKAKNLEILRNLKLKRSIIPEFVSFPVKDWINDPENISKKIARKLNKRISIRSSYFLEDNKDFSMAGEFEGFSDIYNSKEKIIYQTNKLINQYKKKSNLASHILKSEVLYQNYVSDSLLSGVVTNKCLKDGTDYYVINYDDETNQTNTVTSGSAKGSRVLNVYKKNINGIRSENFKKIIYAVKEIESKIPSIGLDIEFAIDSNMRLNIFQIRPLSTSKNWERISKNKFDNCLIYNQKKFSNILKKSHAFGSKPIFGLMPDWNPAEIIGYQPNLLSYSLYKKIITNNSWSLARKKMGYNYVRRPLMYSFAGKPYIDTRLSYHSMLPAKTSKKIIKKLTNFWSDNLKDKPYLHDKIEFKIVDGSFDANSLNKINKKYNFLSYKEKKNYLNVLREFTNNQIFNHENDFNKLDDKLKLLENYRLQFLNKYLKNKHNSNKKDILNFINKIKNFGIISFSIYARHAFIGKKLLNSLVDKKIISNNTYFKLLNSVRTITSDFIILEKESSINKKKKEKFINYFFHLRPGTYDINIKRYKSLISTYKINDLDKIFSREVLKYRLKNTEKKQINKFLKKNNFNFDYHKLINYCLSSMRMRENAKFIFTRSLSDLLEIIKEIGKKNNINKKKLSKLNLNLILNLNKNNKNKCLRFIKKNEELNKINHKIKLPYLITSKDDFFIASILISKPNFITKKITKGNLLNLDLNKNDISNKIVLIENADPGYDWIFSFKIKGLITKYGGVNSHMSIRCEELNIPAAIGIGEDNFNKIKNFSNILLNCKNEQIVQI